jgi:hypothetical protein
MKYKRSTGQDVPGNHSNTDNRKDREWEVSPIRRMSQMGKTDHILAARVVLS